MNPFAALTFPNDQQTADLLAALGPMMQRERFVVEDDCFGQYRIIFEGPRRREICQWFWDQDQQTSTRDGFRWEVRCSDKVATLAKLTWGGA